MADYLFNEDEQDKQKNWKDYSDDLMKQKAEHSAQMSKERLENRQMFGVEMSDDEYYQFKDIIADAENPEQEAHRIGSAVLLSRNFDIDLADAYLNIDNYNQALYGPTEKITDYKNFYDAIKDSVMIGANGLTLGKLGQKLKYAELDGQTELAEEILKQVELLNKDNELRKDNAPRSWVTEQLKSGMQSAPFSGQAAALGFFGNFVMPGLGTALAFGSSSSMAAGQEYLDLREQGVSPETAAKVSEISGGIQGLIEVTLGETLDYAVAGAGKSLSKSAASNIAKKASEKFAKIFHYGGAAKTLASILGAKALDVTGEGLEEVAQETTDIIAVNIARTIDGLGLSDETAADVKDRLIESFRGGVVGAIVLGIPMDVANTHAEIKYYKFAKQTAKDTPSFEVWKKLNENNPVFDTISEDKKADVMKDVWQKAQNEADKELELRAKEYAEVIGSTENFEEENVDEETGESVTEPEYRNEETGLLHSQNVVTSEEDGIVKGVVGVGDPTKETQNKYAEISYTLDEDNNTVTIDELKIGKVRRDLRGEIYDSFARQFPGMEIKWNAIGKIANEWKTQFEEANPYGPKNGLNYYKSTDDIADVETRKNVVKQIREAYQKAGKQLTSKQLAADTVILESLYRRLREQEDFKSRNINTFSDYIAYTFGQNIFGDAQVAIESAQQQNFGEDVLVQGAAKSRTLQELDRDIKSIIYVTENSDFSTFSHEMAHIARKQLTGDLLKQVEDAIGVEDGNWTVDNEEKFAYGFEQFLREGKVENEALRPFYEKVAQFLVDCMNRLKNVVQMTPDIEKTYNELLSKGDNSTLALAEKAVEQEENARKAKELQQKKDEELAQQKETEQQKATEQDIKEDESEVYFDEEESPVEETVAEEPAVEESENELSETLAETGLSDEEKLAVSEVLNDEESSITEKTQAADDASDDAYEQIDLFEVTVSPKQEAEATECIKDYPKSDQDRLYRNFELLRGTPYYNSLVRAMLVRRDIETLLDGKPIPSDSYFKTRKGKKLYKILSDGDTRQERIDNLYEYFDCESTLIGEPSKPINAIGSSYINCNPSLACAIFCYAVKGRGAFMSNIVNKELINFCIENNPKEAAKIAGPDYKTTREFKNGVALRLLDTGDLSEKWLEFIEELNKQDISCQVFSKRPELLSKIDSNKNVVLLSIDSTNLDIAYENPTLPIAFVYSDISEIKLLEEMKERYEKYGGVILPVVKQGANNKLAAKERVKALPKWTIPFTCPIDAGWKKIGNNRQRRRHKELWNCSVCDTNGQGCFFMRAIEDRKGFFAKLEEMPIGVVNAIIDEFEARVGDRLRKLGVPEYEIRSIRQEMGIVRDEKLAGIDTEGTRTGYFGFPGTLSETTGKEGSEGRQTESKGNNNLNFQTVYKNLEDYYVKDITDTYATEEDKQKAESELDKIGTHSNNRTNKAVWSIIKELKSHKCAEVIGRKVDLDFAGRITDDGWNQLREILDIYRNKSFETFRYLLINNNGEIVSHYGVSAKLPGVSPIEPTGYHGMFVTNIKQMAQDQHLQIVLVHNHPSGIVQQSQEDIVVTESLKDYFGPYYGGHMILDHNKYSLSTRLDNADEWNTIAIEGKPKDNLLKTTKQHSEILGSEINNSYELSQQIAKLYDVDDKVALFYTNAVNQIVGLEYINNDRFTENNLNRLQKHIRNNALKFGAHRVLSHSDETIGQFINQHNDYLMFTDNDSVELDFNPGIWDKDKKNYVGFSVQEDTQKEYESIRQQYENTDKYLKAPNGKDSNLTEKQWLQVRTPSFKKWFGDWENDLENASKALDENGEPLVVYHGTIRNYTVEKFDIFDSISGTYWFAKDKKYSENYANAEWEDDVADMYECYLKYNNPLEVGELNEQGNIEELVDILTQRTGFDKNTIRSLSKDYYENLWEITNSNEFKEYVMSLGYDSLIATEFDNDTIAVFNPNQIKSATDNSGAFDKNNDSILLQTAYHGSAADFDKFNTDQYGFSGEGSMSFGYGVYLSGSKDIAEQYANEISYELKRNKEAYEGLKTNIEKHKKALEEGYFYSKKTGEKTKIGSPFDKNEAEDNIFMLERALNNWYYPLSDDPKANIYTIDIPDTEEKEYLNWNKLVPKQEIELIKSELYKELINNDTDQSYVGKAADYLKKDLNASFVDEMTGSMVYGTVSSFIGSQRSASKFLNKLGIIGIIYPSGTLSGIENSDINNYVIFNDEDAKIVNHLLYQTQSELYANARTFDTWQDFMEFYEVMGKPEVTPIPYDADAQWYQTTWELANNVTPEESINTAQVEDKKKNEGTVPTALDSMFVANVVMNDEALLDFLRTLSAYDAIDLNSEEYSQVADAEDAAERDRISQLKDYMKTIMYSRSWKQAMASLKAGNDPTDVDLRNVRGEMRDNFKSRDFRALYAEVTGDEQYAVADEDKPANIMAERYAKHPERYYDIVKADEDFANYSPEKRKQISKAMDNADLAEKIRTGKLKMDDEVNNYIKLLDRQIKELKNQLTEQEIESENDFKRIADAERRELLKLHEKMLIAKSKYNGTNDEITRKMNKGIRITSKYARESQNLKADYDELFRKFSDLKNMIVIDAQVEAALKRQEQIHQIKEEIGTKQQEKNRTAEEKKLRVQLVKRTMRRIDFKKIDYEDAKTIIAIQRMFEPNLMGGVNRWIGTEGPFLRGVISGILTDVEYKEQIEKYLRQNAKSSQAYMDFVRLLSETKTIEDFNKWTQKDRKSALRYLPKENWIRDLNLVKLAKEREESVDLDIGVVEKQKPVIDEKTGNPKTYKDAEGIEHPATQTQFVLSYSDEVAQRVKDAIGADMFDNLINVPFADWTFNQLEELAVRINALYKQGRDQLEGKRLARKEESDRIREQIESAVKNTGIIINDDDDDETKKRKQEKINKILGLTGTNTKGSDTSKDTGFKARMNRLLHSYNDANVLRVARILDGYTEGTNVLELYRKEDVCYNNKARSMNARANHINQIMADNNITPSDLATIVSVEVEPGVIQEYSIDDLLYFMEAAKDYELKDNGEYDNMAACSRNAVMYGNMYASPADLEQKEKYAEILDTDELGNNEGLQQYILNCQSRFDRVIDAAKALDPKYQKLAEAIAEDYAAQYDRMNKVSVEQFNQPVHRVKCYVPLNRLESNGDTNINKVKEDLLAAMGANATKQGVGKGMTARRIRISPLHQKPVVTGLYKTWADSVERTEHFIAYAEYVNELNRVYKNRDAGYTRQFIENRYGKGMVRYIDDYINEVANPGANKVREAGAELLHTLRGRTAPAYLAWKASAIVKQGLTSPFPFMQYINPAEYLSASWKAITSKGEIYKAIREKSVYMNNRVMDPMNDLIDEMAEHGKTKFDRVMGKQSQKGMAGLEWIDWVCVAPGWYAAYQKEYARLNGKNEAVYEAAKERLQEENAYAEVGTSAWKTSEQIEAEARKLQEDDVEARAVQYADDITRACQPSNRSVDLAPLFKNSSEAMKAYLQFQTSLNVIWQNIRYDTQYIARKPDAVTKEQFFQITGIIIGYALAGIFMNAVMDGLGGDDDKDGSKADDRLKNLVYYATTQFTDSVPMIGSELTNTMDRLITGKASYQNSGTDMTPTATKLFAILTNASKGNWEKAAQMTAEGIGMYLGLPVSGLKEVEKILGVGDEEPGIDVHLGKVYGILDKEQYE